MEHGDLAAAVRERLVIVLEGVLAFIVDEVTTTGRIFKREQVTAYHIGWHDIPLKRLVTIQRRYGERYDVEVITFRSQVLADQAAEYLQAMNIPIDTVRYQAYDEFCMSLRFADDVRAVYDSDPDRLDGYGQVGVAVIRSEDF